MDHNSYEFYYYEFYFRDCKQVETISPKSTFNLGQFFTSMSWSYVSWQKRCDLTD